MRYPLHSLTPLDLSGVPFERVPMRFLSSGGTPYIRWVPHGMPQLGQYKWILDAVFFLYRSVEDAKKGVAFGGTGFLVAVASSRWPNDYFHVHGVTNWHVACQRGSSVIRVNRIAGGHDTFEYDPSEWEFASGWHDVAVSPPLPLDAAIHRASAIGVDSFVSGDDETVDDIGPAEDVFMLGRFIDYDGEETNTPACRFGNISIASANIKQPSGFLGRSIVVDMHSRTGFSGSPLFIYRNPGSTFAPMMDIVLSWHYFKLLGIHWGQFPEAWELKDGKKASPAAQASLITDGKYVEGLSGMSCACPAAAILEILNRPRMVAMRDEVEKSIAPDMRARGLRPVPTGLPMSAATFDPDQ